MQYPVRTPWWLKLVFPKDFVWNIAGCDKPTVFLTFDDGPHPEITPFVLDLLNQYEARASFFCVGENVGRYPDTFRQIQEQGHATGNHTYNHLNGWKTQNSVYLGNIDKAHALIDSTLFRPPYGKIRNTQAGMLRKRHPGWRVIMWDVLSGDFDRGLTPGRCLANVLETIRPGSIVLFHDSEKAWDRMSYALPRVLEFCRNKGWDMAAI